MRLFLERSTWTWSQAALTGRRDVRCCVTVGPAQGCTAAAVGGHGGLNGEGAGMETGRHHGDNIQDVTQSRIPECLPSAGVLPRAVSGRLRLQINTMFKGFLYGTH